MCVKIYIYVLCFLNISWIILFLIVGLWICKRNDNFGNVYGKEE